MALAYHAVSAKRNSLSLETLNTALATGEHGLALYVQMANLANHEDKCWPTISDLCDLTDLSKNTVKKYLAALESTGVITVLQKGQHRGLPTIYQLHDTVVMPETPANIVNLFTEKGSNSTPIVKDFTEKGSNSELDPWFTESTADEKGSIAGEGLFEKGVNDSKERGQRQCTYSPTPPSSMLSDEINNTTRLLKEPTVDFNTAQWLAQTPELQTFANEHKLQQALLIRSLNQFETKALRQQPAKDPLEAIRRARGWLRKGEANGIHGGWRKEAPWEMAGVIPK